ncbi:hypothetical protein QWI39_19895, partial [Acinetobacter baumannii]|uniref:hypothetical protein n=1 Tax=Acinetobacter baumannii TaxID=470 RepID=UPI002740D56E
NYPYYVKLHHNGTQIVKLMLNVSQFYLILLTNWKYFLSIVNDYFSHNMIGKLSLKNNVKIIFMCSSYASRFTMLQSFFSHKFEEKLN